MFETRLALSYDGHDGFGIGLGLYDNNMDRIGSITYRLKTYLNNKGYPEVNELHLGFLPEYQGKGYFQDALFELLKYDDTPIYASKGRVINPLVFKAIDKLNRDIFVVTEIEDVGHIITLK
jgi:hypothetical protein